MWVPVGLIFAIIMTVVFFRWVARGEDSKAGAPVDGSRVRLVLRSQFASLRGRGRRYPSTAPRMTARPGTTYGCGSNDRRPRRVDRTLPPARPKRNSQQINPLGVRTGEATSMSCFNPGCLVHMNHPMTAFAIRFAMKI